MLQRKYARLDQTIFSIDRKPEEIVYIDDIDTYNNTEGLALSSDEIDYLNSVSKRWVANSPTVKYSAFRR